MGPALLLPALFKTPLPIGVSQTQGRDDRLYQLLFCCVEEGVEFRSHRKCVNGVIRREAPSATDPVSFVEGHPHLIPLFCFEQCDVKWRVVLAKLYGIPNSGWTKPVAVTISRQPISFYFLRPVKAEWKLRCSYHMSRHLVLFPMNNGFTASR